MNKIKISGIIAGIISILIIFIVIISGCISSNSSNTQTHMVSNSFFQVPEGWNSGPVGGIPNPTTSFLYEDTNLMLFIEQYDGEEDFNVESGKHRPNSTHKLDISGINVTYMQDSVSNYVVSRYYFQKNGKYFLVQIGDNRKNKNYPDQKFINDTVKTVITTIN